MADIDAKLRKALTDAKNREMFFGFIPTSSSDGKLVVCKSKSDRDKQVKEAKEELGGGKEVKGTCNGPIGKMVFEVNRVVSNLVTSLKNAAKPAGLVVKAEIITMKEAEMEAKEAALADKQAAEDAKGG